MVAFAVEKPRKNDFKQWDDLLVRFMEYLYLDGAALGAARYALYGCAYHEDWPIRSADCMPLAKATLKAYRRRSPDQSRDPPCEEMLWLVVDWLLSNRTNPFLYGLAAAYALLAWDCYLRPQEALDLKVADVTRPQRVADIQRWSLTIAPKPGGKPAKNRQFDAGVVVGEFNRKWAEDILKVLVDFAPRSGFLFHSLSLAQLDKMFVECSSALNFKVAPHGMRHGGPSTDAFKSGASLSLIQTRGRWQCLESVRIYMKPAALLRSVKLLTASQLRKAAACKEACPTRVVAALRKVLIRPSSAASVGRKRPRDSPGPR